MCTKPLRRLTSILLFAAIVFSMAAAGASGTPAQAATDPFSEMKDEYLMTDGPYDPDEASREDHAREDMGSQDLFLPRSMRQLLNDRPLPEPDTEAVKISRYIVK